MIRLRQALVIAAGAVLAAVMVLLGLWQLDVYHEQGQRTAERRAAEAPVALTAVAPAGATVTDGYGRSVSFSGRYDAARQLLVPVDGQPDQFRVLTPLRQDDGSVVPVVRGLVTGPEAPPPPAEPVQETGVLLPSEDDATRATLPPGQLAGVRLPALAQTWPGPLVNGYVTLPAAESRAEGLSQVDLVLPKGRGRLQNGAYAIQWWVFAVFAFAMAVRIARDIAVRDAIEDLDASSGAAAELGDLEDAPPPASGG